MVCVFHILIAALIGMHIRRIHDVLEKFLNFPYLVIFNFQDITVFFFYEFFNWIYIIKVDTYMYCLLQ